MKSVLASRSSLQTYAVAVLLSCVALAITDWIGPLSDRSPFLLPVAAVMMASWYGGLGSGLLVTILCILGVNYLVRDERGSPDITDDPLVQIVAYSSVALLVAWLNDSRRQAQWASTQSAERLRFLASVSREITEVALDLDATVEAVSRRAADALGDGCVLSVLHGAWLQPKGIYHPDVAARNDLFALFERNPQCLGHGLAGRAAADGRPLQVSDVRLDKGGEFLRPEYRAFAERFGVHRVLVCPLRARGAVVGTIQVWRDLSKPSFDDADVVLLKELATVAALAIDNARLHAETQAAEARFRGLFEGMPDPTVVCGPDRRIVNMNPALVDLSGYRREELIGRELDALLALLDCEDCDVASVVTEHANGQRDDVQVRRRDGTGVPVETRALSVELSSGPAHVISMRDVSERKAAERLRADFLASVSHDLRTPLTAIRAGIGLLTESLDAHINEEERTLLADTARSTEHLGRLIDDLLVLRHLMAGELVLERATIDLRELVAQVLPVIHPLVEAKAQRLELDVPTPLPVKADGRRLAQAISNLLANASEHTPYGSSIEVSGHVADDVIRLSVADDGPGIPDADLEQVFDRFYRLDAGGKGSGLGLPLARGVIELHDGSIWAERRLGGGTVFHIALPCAGRTTDDAP